MMDISLAPPQQSKVSLIHKVAEFYKKIYLLSSKIPKRDRFGIYQKSENIYLELNTILIAATFETRSAKLDLLSSARIKIEILKRLFRTMEELGIIRQEKYIKLELDLQEISKMTNGWIKYLKEKSSQ